MTQAAPSRLARVLPFLAALVAILPDPAAALPLMTYWFRDFTVTFYPLRRLAAGELAAGRMAWWNPYVNEGAFVLPMLYPVDLLHALFPGPVAVSWLLTLHLPLAALAAYALARDLGTSRLGAFAAGCIFATGGLAVSSLNLYVFLQALALAPLVVLTLRRAALCGGAWTVAAAGVLAVSLTTLAVEFVAQAVLLGLVTAWGDRSDARGGARMALACGIGVALAAVPLLTVAAVLPETVRGAGFSRDVALGNEAHPAALLQLILPRAFGDPAAPVDAWWGGRFLTKGFPYFLTLYVGPLAVALALLGLADVPSRRRAAWLVVAGLAAWYALGARGGLAPLLASAPGMGFFRFPSKALLTPFLVGALAAGAGLDHLSVGARWRRMALITATLAAIGLAVALAAGPVAAWIVAGSTPTVALDRVVDALAVDGFRAAGLSAAACALAVAVLRNRLPPVLAAAAVAALLAADLVTAARGINPQAPAAFYQPLPEMAALRLSDLGGGRVFTYGLDESPAFRRFLAAGNGRALWSFFLSRQTLAPYANVIDTIEIAEGKDLTGFIPRAPVLAGEDLDPSRVGAILPRLREAAVRRVVSLDALVHPELRERARIDAGPPGVAIHVYEVANPLPRAFVTCGDACTGAVRRTARVGETTLAVDAPSAGVVVVRDNFARGWEARVDGARAAVVRIGDHLGVAVPAGRHEVLLRYRPPGLRTGLLLTACGFLAAGVLLARSRA